MNGGNRLFNLNNDANNNNNKMEEDIGKDTSFLPYLFVRERIWKLEGTREMD